MRTPVTGTYISIYHTPADSDTHIWPVYILRGYWSIGDELLYQSVRLESDRLGRIIVADVQDKKIYSGNRG